MRERPFNVRVTNFAIARRDISCLAKALQDLSGCCSIVFDAKNFASPKPQRRNIHETLRNDDSPRLCSLGLSFGGRSTDWWRSLASTRGNHAENKRDIARRNTVWFRGTNIKGGTVSLGDGAWLGSCIGRQSW